MMICGEIWVNNVWDGLFLLNDLDHHIIVAKLYHKMLSRNSLEPTPSQQLCFEVNFPHCHIEFSWLDLC